MEYRDISSSYTWKSVSEDTTVDSKMKICINNYWNLLELLPRLATLV